MRKTQQQAGRDNSIGRQALVGQAAAYSRSSCKQQSSLQQASGAQQQCPAQHLRVLQQHLVMRNSCLVRPGYSSLRSIEGGQQRSNSRASAACMLPKACSQCGLLLLLLL